MSKTKLFITVCTVGVTAITIKAAKQIEKERTAEYNLGLASRAARYVSRKMENGGYNSLQEMMDEYEFIMIVDGK